MRLLSIFFLFVLSMMGHVACDSEPQEEDSGLLSYETDTPEGDAIRRCEQLLDRGCLRGQIAHATNFFVNGVEFFDSFDLNEYLKNAVDLKDKNGADLPKAGYEVEVVSRIGNDNFAAGFDIAVSGAEQLGNSRAVGESGSFLIANLRAGDYRVRAYRRIPIMVTLNGASQSQTYCVTLYQDKRALVSNSSLTSMIIDDFNLRYYNKECSQFSHGDLDKPQAAVMDTASVNQGKAGGEAPSQRIAVGPYAPVEGLTNIKDAVPRDDDIVFIYQEDYRVKYASLMGGEVSQISLSGYTISTSKNYRIVGGETSELFLLDLYSKELLRFDQEYSYVGTSPFDCGSRFGSISSDALITVRDGDIHYLSSKLHEVCSLDGLLKSSKVLNGSTLGGEKFSIGHDMGVMASDGVLGILGFDLTQKGEVVVEGFPFNNIEAVHHKGMLRLFGCRAERCYMGSVAFGE